MRFVGVIVVLAACSFERGATPNGDDAGVADDARIADAAAVGDASAACPSTYTSTHGSSRYRRGSGDWYVAEAACETEGTHLVVIETGSENTFVLTLDSSGSIWIGMSDHVTEGTFRWVTGALVTAGYQNWQDQQPSNLNGHEDCTEMNNGAVWNDKVCTTSQTYVCECDGAPPPITPTWCHTGIDTSCDTCSDNCAVSGNQCDSAQQCQ